MKVQDLNLGVYTVSLNLNYNITVIYYVTLI